MSLCGEVAVATFYVYVNALISGDRDVFSSNSLESGVTGWDILTMQGRSENNMSKEYGSQTLWLKVDLRSKCEFLNTSHLLIEGYILEIGHGKIEYSLTIYLTTKKISATSERAHAHRSQKRARAAVFAY